MDDGPPPTEVGAGHIVTGSLIVRVTLILVALGITAACLYECSRIPGVEVQLREGLGGKPLPLATQWIFKYRAGFLMAAMFIPGVALTTFLQRDHWTAVGALLFIILVGALLLLLVHWALKIPLSWLTM